MSDGEAVLLVVHLAATAAMCGLIWFVQVVHYPLFAGVGDDGFTAYEQRHQRAQVAAAVQEIGIAGRGVIGVREPLLQERRGGRDREEGR